MAYENLSRFAHDLVTASSSKLPGSAEGSRDIHRRSYFMTCEMVIVLVRNGYRKLLKNGAADIAHKKTLFPDYIIL